MSTCRTLTDERGVALPMALITLVALTTLMLAFAVLSQTEPVIAANQLRVSQARAMAESGFERAVWALTQGNLVAPATCALPCLSQPLPGTPATDDPVTAPAPYDGSTFIAVGTTGGYTLRVVTPAPLSRPLDRDITAVGWTPTDSALDTRTKAHRQISATVQALPNLALNAPCVLCVRGDVAVQGSSLIDSTTDGNCGGPVKAGAYTSGTLTRTGSSDIKGQRTDGTTGSNVEGIDYRRHQDASAFDAFTLSAANMAALRELARRNNAYFGPGSPNGSPAASPAWTGSVTFNASNTLKSGVVFVDTLDGTAITADTPDSHFASVDIHGNPFVDAQFSGYLIVNGRLSISGNMTIGGLVYAVDDLTYNGTGTGYIEGLVISQNVRNSTATTVSDTDTTAGGNSKVRLNCANARGDNAVPKSFLLVGGTYREQSD